jgi:hypothetical protein
MFTRIALTTILFLAAVPGMAAAQFRPTQNAIDQANCDARFAGQDMNLTRQARKACVHRVRLARKDQADRARLYAKDWADREALFARDQRWLYWR